MHQQVPLPAEYLRALGNLFSLAAMLALHRGVRLFIAAPLPTGAHALAFVIVLLVSWLGLTPAYAALRVSVNAAVLAAIASPSRPTCIATGATSCASATPGCWRCRRGRGGGFSLRGCVRCGAESVAPEMITDSNVNLVSAVVYMVIALTFHATLIGLWLVAS